MAAASKRLRIQCTSPPPLFPLFSSVLLSSLLVSSLLISSRLFSSLLASSLLVSSLLPSSPLSSFSSFSFSHFSLIFVLLFSSFSNFFTHSPLFRCTMYSKMRPPAPPLLIMHAQRTEMLCGWFLDVGLRTRACADGHALGRPRRAQPSVVRAIRSFTAFSPVLS